MSKRITRRKFAGSVLATAAAAGVAADSLAAESGNSKASSRKLIVGVSCSPRKGMTTAVALQAALDAAKEASPNIDVKLLDLGEMRIAGWSPAIPEDDFEKLLPTLRSENLGGLIIGSPVYFRTISALCKSFLERLAVLRSPNLQLAGVPVGALSVGAYRNGGQELAIQEIHNAMLCHEAVVVGGKAGAFQGATLLNAYQDDITKDEFGMESARKLGIRVVEAALNL